MGRQEQQQERARQGIPPSGWGFFHRVGPDNLLKGSDGKGRGDCGSKREEGQDFRRNTLHFAPRGIGRNRHAATDDRAATFRNAQRHPMSKAGSRHPEGGRNNERKRAEPVKNASSKSQLV